ncbi:Cytochrome P450 2U1 [Holothuria leucospilota]|uniref:Cytochrome P450 2U1 n=1 Tax=Holothuria leucospilota TaxID=206669 RepID=A0A9Q1CAJ8_HOLLE|nr:Cytochrome P450 2U1 [Holothuria leucospilota]
MVWVISELLLPVAAVVAGAYFLYKIFKKPPNMPPGPKPHWLFGNIPQMKGKQTYQAIQDFHKEFGGIYSISLLTGKVVVITDWDIFNEAAVTNADAFSDRFLPPVLDVSIKREGSILFGNGPGWTQRRKFALPLFHKLDVKSVEERIKFEARYLTKKFQETAQSPFDPLDYVRVVAANVIFNITVGKRYDYEDEESKRMIKTFNNFFDNVLTVLPLQLAPRLIYTPTHSYFRGYINTIRDYVNAKVAERKKTFDGSQTTDLIDMFLKEAEKGGNAVVQEDLTWRLVLEFFGTGMDAACFPMLFQLLYCTQFPDVQKQLQDEIDSVIGPDREPNYEDKANMPFTQAFLMETLRFRPMAAIDPPNMLFRDVKLAGYDIPKGTRIFFNLWGVLNDQDYWKDPEVFRPSRFLSEDGKTVIEHERFIPYGLGRRVCLGKNVAKMQLFLYLTYLLQRFSFSIPDEDPKPSLDGLQAIQIRPYPYRLRAIPRKDVA